MLIIVHSFVHVEDPIPFPFPIIHSDVSTAPTVEKDDTCCGWLQEFAGRRFLLLLLCGEK
jgi:hypothetical protein